MATDFTAIQRVLWWTMFANLAVAVAKFAYARVSGSVALFADALHSTFDTLGNVVGLVAIRAASRAADEGHPYGHAKFETAASLAIGGMLVASLVEIAQRIYGSLAYGNAPNITGMALLVVAGSAVVSLFVSFFEFRAGVRLGSDVLTADSKHTLGDVAASATILASFLGIRAGFAWADIVGALIAALTIAAAAWSVLRRSVSVLVDEARIPIDGIRAVVMQVPGVRGSRAERTRGLPGAVLCDLAIAVDPYISVEAGHEIGHAVEKRLREVFPHIADVVVHVEPDAGGTGS